MRPAHARAPVPGFRTEESANSNAEDRKRARLRALKRLQEGAETFEDFVYRVMPAYFPVPMHLRPLYDLIQRSRHEQVRAVISMPPRHGKTETLRLGLAWRLLYDPACLNAYASFESGLSEDTGRTVRNLARKIGLKVGKAPENENKSTKAGAGKVLDWRTSYGGGLKSTSVGGAITGRGITGLLVIDDPIKGAEAARSLTERERVWRWLRSDVLSRLEGGSSCIIVQTRWHEDDPIGRIISEAAADSDGLALGEKWLHINLPAVGDMFGNPLDEKLDPTNAAPLWDSINSRYPNSREHAMRWYQICRARGEYEWWSLYQGVPRSESQKIFANDPALFQMPLVWTGKRGIVILDPAAQAKTSSDHSGLGAYAMDGYGDDAKLYVARYKKYRVSMPEITREAYRWQQKFKLPIGIEAVAGFAMIPQTLRETYPKLKIIEIQAVKDKYTRAIPVSRAWQENRVLVPMGLDANGEEIDIGWDLDDYTRVMQAFTGLGDKEDEAVDCTAHAWNRMWKPYRKRSGQNVHAPAY